MLCLFYKGTSTDFYGTSYMVLYGIHNKNSAFRIVVNHMDFKFTQAY